MIVSTLSLGISFLENILGMFRVVGWNNYSGCSNNKKKFMPKERKKKEDVKHDNNGFFTWSKRKEENLPGLGGEFNSFSFVSLVYLFVCYCTLRHRYYSRKTDYCKPLPLCPAVTPKVVIKKTEGERERERLDKHAKLTLIYDSLGSK